MIEIDGLTKRYGDKTAVDGLSFVVEPGVVTGFLGPNGAGKSTTMRMIAGLDRPTSNLHRPEEAVMTAPHAVLKKFPVEIRDLSKHFGPATTVRAQDPVRLTGALERRGHRVDRDGDVLNALGATPEEVGEIAGHEQLAVLGLAPRTRSLEEAFIALTGVQS